MYYGHLASAQYEPNAKPMNQIGKVGACTLSKLHEVNYIELSDEYVDVTIVL